MFLWNDSVLNDLKVGLNATNLRQQAIANNLANLNTPGFKRSTVSFEENLRQARAEQGGPPVPLRTTHPAHFGPPEVKEITPQVEEDAYGVMRIDGNNVDIEREMLDMATNQIRHNALVQRLGGRLNTWRTIINQGRG